MSKVKQVIIIRKDLKMTKGKMIAQGSHASTGVILGLMDRKVSEPRDEYEMTLKVSKGSALEAWLDVIFTKICVYVESEEELVELYNQAIAANLPACLITDRGLTHFKGVPTKTALAIGPCFSADVDIITGNLPLL